MHTFIEHLALPGKCRVCGETEEKGDHKRVFPREDAVPQVTPITGYFFKGIPAEGIEAEVCRDIATRQQKGIAKYGTTVANNPAELKEWLQHAYEECLDQAVYLRKAMLMLEAGRYDDLESGR